MMMPVLAFGFITPWLFAAGAAATSVPIIIHLLNKRRFRIVVWAAMDFLLAAQRRNARRLKFQRWLLLALRCLALLVLAAAIAQLTLSSTAIGGMLSGDRVLVAIWDDSYSMGFARPNTPSAFEKSKKLLTEWVAGLPAGDRVMVIRASTGGQLPGNKPTLDREAIRRAIEASTVSDAGTDLASAFDQGADVLKDLEKSTRSRQVVVLTDGSASSLKAQGGAKGQAADSDRLKKSAENLKKLTTGFKIVDVGSSDQMNLAVTDLRPERPVVVAGMTAEFRVMIQNATNAAQSDLPITVLLDGVIVHTDRVAKIDAGASRSIVVPVTIATPGRHHLEARIGLENSMLPVDDVRRLMVNVQREVPLLLVDGSPGDNRTLGSATYLWVAYNLSSDAKSASLFAPRIVSELELATTPLKNYAAVILSDTAEPRGTVLEALQRYVKEDGGLLMILPGPRTNAEQMNAALGERGAKMLPATFGQPVKLEGSEQIQRGLAFNAEGFTHPVLAKFGDAYKRGEQVGFLSVQTNQYFKLGVPKDGSSEVVLRYQSDANDAAVVTQQVGKGRVTVFASTADTRWNSFGAKPSFVPFMHELMFYCLPRDTDGLTLTVGERINLLADASSAETGKAPVPGAWTAPKNGRINVTQIVDKDSRARLQSSALTLAGYYAPATGNIPNVVAVNVDAAEADIRHQSPAQISAALGVETGDILQNVKALETRSEGDGDSGGNNIARALLLAGLILLVAETVMARLFSVYR